MQTFLDFKPINPKSKPVNKVDPNEIIDNLEEEINYNDIYLSPEHFLKCLDVSWRKYLISEVKKPYFNELLTTLNNSKDLIFPLKENVLNSFKWCKFENTKVVIIGQDPYHDNNQAHGLSFSVQKGIDIPPSLRNIYKELKNSLGSNFNIPNHGCLESWAKQGVLLLNATLTVKAHEANSHSKFGWNNFTSSIIEIINKNLEGVVFISWGKFAQNITKNIDKKKHFKLESGHPSPLSQNKFFGCDHFKKTNSYLLSIGKTPINWNSLND